MTVAVLDMDIRNPGGGEWSGRVDRFDCYTLGSTDLTRYVALIITSAVDQEHLARQRRVIRSYLDGGGVVVFGGHLHRDWLPGASAFIPLANRSLAGYRVVEIADHPIFRGRGPDELTFRRGVAGFFARGHHPIPAGAEVLTRFSGGEPATYLDRVSPAGTIVVQATSDLLSYCGAALLDWVTAESAQRRSIQHRSTQRRAQAAGRPRGLAAVYGGSAQHHRALTEPKYAQYLTGGLIYLPELAGTDLTAYRGLLIPERLHRGLLTGAADRISELLDAGGTVIAFSGGEPVPEFLPGVRWQHRPTNYWWWLEPDADLGVPLRQVRTRCSSGLRCGTAPGITTGCSNRRTARRCWWSWPPGKHFSMSIRCPQRAPLWCSHWTRSATTAAISCRLPSDSSTAFYPGSTS